MKFSLPAIVALVLLAARGCPAGDSHQTLLCGLRHEQGVESKMLLTSLVRHQVAPRVGITGGVSFSLFQHNGISNLGLEADVLVTDFWHVGLTAGVQHDQWTDWRIGENRAFGTLNVEPLPRLGLGIGAAYRAPVFDPDRYQSPFHWQSDVPEWNLLYRLEWRFLHRENADASFRVSNLDRLRLYNPHHIAFQLRGLVRLNRDWNLVLHCGSGVKGLSAMLLSVTEVTIQAGVRHEL